MSVAGLAKAKIVVDEITSPDYPKNAGMLNLC
jgi:hypothetical protein